MKTEKLGYEPAFPNSNEKIAMAIFNTNGDPTGMSKRFYAACAAMQGLIAGCNVNDGGFDAKWTAKAAFNMANELLKQENL